MIVQAFRSRRFTVAVGMLFALAIAWVLFYHECASGGAMGAWDERFRNFARSGHGSNWRSSAQTLSQRHDIRFDSELFVGKQCSRAPEPCLHLVQNQQ